LGRAWGQGTEIISVLFMSTHTKWVWGCLKKKKISQIKQTSILVIAIKKEYTRAVKMYNFDSKTNARVNVSKLGLYLRH